ncbi:MAG: tetratricopeptide repeat protein, partial [Planctomycetota bacterium]
DRPPTGRAATWTKREGLLALALAACVFAVYGPALSGGFVWLDHFEIVEGGMIVDRWSDVPRRFIEPGNYAGYHRPLYDLMHSFDRAVWGLNPFGFHLSSVTLHALNAVLVFLLLARLGMERKLRFGIAALWAVHPVNAVVAGLIHAKADLLVTFFALVTASLLDRGVRSESPGRRGLFIALGMLAWAAALMSKETALVLPLLLGLALPWKRMEDADRRRWLGLTLGLAASALVLLFARRGGIVGLEAEASLFERLATFGTVLVGYVVRLFWPMETSLSDATVAWSALHPLQRGGYVAALLLLGFALLQLFQRARSSRPWILLFLVALAPVSQVIPLLHFRADRFLYLPSLGWIGLLFASAVPLLLGRGREEESPAKGALGWLPLALALTLVPVTWSRIATFRTDETLFGQESPITSTYREGLAAYAVALDREGRFEEATPYHARALVRDPRIFAYAEDSTLVVNFTRNLLARRRPDQVLQLVEGFLGSEPVLRDRERDVLRYNQGVALHQLGHYEEALPLLEAFAQKTDDASAWFLTGNAARESGNRERAVSAWTRYLERVPHAPERASIQEYLTR